MEQSNEPDATGLPKGPPKELLHRLREELEPDLEILRPLGSGRAAWVFMARDRALGRLVALKVLRQELGADSVAARRFEREGRSLAALVHPSVVDVHRLGRLSDGTPYMVMRYVEGQSAEARVLAQGPLKPDRAREMLATVASALAAAHRHGIVHRDVRPANILLEEETGQALLADFGVAALLPKAETGHSPKLTRQGETLGIPAFASPEQLRDEPVTEASDIYSLGVTGYVLLTGELPYDSSSDRALLVAHLTGEPRPLPDVDPGLADVLKRCLAKSPERRPTASWVAERLAAETDEEEPPATTAAGRLVRRIRRRRIVQILLAYVAAGITAIGVVGDLVSGEVLSRTAFQVTLVTVLTGLLLAAIIGWYHGEKGVQRVEPLEAVLLLATGIAGVLVGLLVVL